MDKTDNAYLINFFQENKINLSTHQYNPDTSTKYRIGHNTNLIQIHKILYTEILIYAKRYNDTHEGIFPIMQG